MPGDPRRSPELKTGSSRRVLPLPQFVVTAPARPAAAFAACEFVNGRRRDAPERVGAPLEHRSRSCGGHGEPSIAFGTRSTKDSDSYESWPLATAATPTASDGSATSRQKPSRRALAAHLHGVDGQHRSRPDTSRHGSTEPPRPTTKSRPCTSSCPRQATACSFSSGEVASSMSGGARTVGAPPQYRWRGSTPVLLAAVAAGGVPAGAPARAPPSSATTAVPSRCSGWSRPATA